MPTPREREWTASIVISSEHAGLRPHFKQLEAELYHALASIDDPRDVRGYLAALVMESKGWIAVLTGEPLKK